MECWVGFRPTCPAKETPAGQPGGPAAGMIDGTLIGKPGNYGLEKIYFLQFKPRPDDPGNPTGEYGDLQQFSHNVNIPEQKTCKPTALMRYFLCDEITAAYQAHRTMPADSL